MATTLLQLRSRLQARGYETDTATAQTEAINTGLRTLLGDFRWPFLEKQNTSIVTVIGQQEYNHLATITDLLHISSVRAATATSFVDLEYMVPEELSDQAFFDRTNAAPQYWTVINEKLQIYPRPNAVYTLTINYIYDPPDLVADTDAIAPVPDVYSDTILFAALAEMAARTRDWAQHDRWMNKYEQRKSRMKQELGLRQRQSDLTVGRSGFFDASGLDLRGV